MKYEIQCSTFQPSNINSQNLLHYCLIKRINEEHCFSVVSDKVRKTSFYSFKVFIKHRVLDTYKSTCEIIEY